MLGAAKNVTSTAGTLRRLCQRTRPPTSCSLTTDGRVVASAEAPSGEASQAAKSIADVVRAARDGPWNGVGPLVVFRCSQLEESMGPHRLVA